MKNNKGFTLVEIIISIAILSILCVVFLQLFVKASDISDRAHELDESVTLTNSTMELVKSIGSIAEMEKAKYFSDFEIIEIADGYKLIKTFNKAFKYDNKDIIYNMVTTLIQHDSIDNSNIKLYDVKCEVIKNEDQSILYEVDSQIILE